MILLNHAQLILLMPTTRRARPVGTDIMSCHSLPHVYQLTGNFPVTVTVLSTALQL